MKTKILTILLILTVLSASGQSDTIVKDFHYYKAEYEKGTKMRNLGKGLVISGPILLGLGVSSALIMLTYEIDDYIAVSILLGLFLTSVVVELIGIPLWIAGGTKRKRSTQMLDQLNYKANISIAPTQHGIGLILRL
jgi:hypothetical protein